MRSTKHNIRQPQLLLDVKSEDFFEFFRPIFMMNKGFPVTYNDAQNEVVKLLKYKMAAFDPYITDIRTIKYAQGKA